jgi:drug/metabolite transporter (DMT)-like permease
VAAFRTLFATIGALVIIWSNKKIKLSWQAVQPWMGIFALIGLTNVALPFILFPWGEQYIPSGIASVLNSTTPLFTIILATFFLQNDRLSPAKAIGLLVGFSGVVLLFLPELQQNQVNNLLGLVAIMIATFCYALGGILIKRNVRGLQFEFQVFLQYASAALMVWTFCLTKERPFILPHQPITWVALLWLGLLGSSLASSLQYRLIHSVGPTRASMITYIPPLVGLLLGAIILGEPLGWETLFGGALILAGIMLVNRH